MLYAFFWLILRRLKFRRGGITQKKAYYVLLIAFPLQQRLQESASMLRYTYEYIACLVSFNYSTNYDFLNCCFTVHFDNFKDFCQQMHSLLKHKMLQLTPKISLYMAPTCFGPSGPSSGSIRRNIAKVTVFVEIISKNTSLKLLPCCGNMCVWHAAKHPVHTAHIATALYIKRYFKCKM
jgi:hypothetical protein